MGALSLSPLPPGWSVTAPWLALVTPSFWPQAVWPYFGTNIAFCALRVSGTWELPGGRVGPRGILGKGGVPHPRCAESRVGAGSSWCPRSGSFPGASPTISHLVPLSERPTLHTLGQAAPAHTVTLRSRPPAHRPPSQHSLQWPELLEAEDGLSVPLTPLLLPDTPQRPPGTQLPQPCRHAPPPPHLVCAWGRGPTVCPAWCQGLVTRSDVRRDGNQGREPLVVCVSH